MITKPSNVERYGFVDFHTMGTQIIRDFKERGFDVIYSDVDEKAATLIPTPNGVFSPDPLAQSQPWCINIDCSTQVLSHNVGSLKICITHPLQAPNSGIIAQDFSYQNPSSTPSNTLPDTYIRRSGELLAGWFPSGKNTPEGIAAPGAGRVSIPFASMFWNGLDLPPDYGVGGKTYAYSLTIAAHGVALVVWDEGGGPDGNKFSWFVVQRLVNPVTGAPKVTGKCPVFCVYSIGGGEPNNVNWDENVTTENNPFVRTHATYDNSPAIYRFTVREQDVLKPTIPVLASVDSPDNRLVINGKQQVGITEENKYVITFPTGFNTDRYFYKDEIDLIVYTSADVFSQGTDIFITVYGESLPRQYRAMQANIQNNTGLRILILKQGPGF